MSAPRKRARISGASSRPLKNSNEEGGGAAFEVPTLPSDFDGVPLDGGQYLALVRQEARRHAPVYRLASDHPYMKQTPAPVLKRETPEVSLGVLAQEMPVPLDGPWHKVYTAKFRDLRHRISSSRPPPGTKRRVARAQEELPEDSNNEGLWFAWLHGFRMREKDSQMVAGAQARRPSMVQLAALDHADKLFILEAITDWIDHPAAQDRILRAQVGSEAVLPLLLNNSVEDTEEADEPVRRAIPSHLAVWTFALLASLSPHLDGDETSMLRQLVRALAKAIKSSRQRTLRVLEEHEGLDQEGNEDEVALLGSKAGIDVGLTSPRIANSARETILAQARSAEGCAWMIIASVIDVWRQTDLWDEIKSTLRNL